MGGYAWVTLATNNSYSLGALVLAHSLKRANTAHKLVVLITPAVSQSMREQLQTVFDLVKVVDVLDSKDEAHLALMKRPDLGITFTKIHCWRLVEFEKCVFLDADTLVVRNCDELFEKEEFSAAPDVSWPDCFNSGVFVYRPSVETFNKLLQFAVENRSFDGGDQGLLNQFFSDWATEDIKKHLPFVYNLTSIAAYSYIPAFKHYGAETRIVHFIGSGKPWLQQLDASTRTVTPSSGSEHLAPLLQQWWDLFCEKVHPNLDKNLESSNDGMSQPPVEARSNFLPIALTDEPQTALLAEPCTPYREKDDFRQQNLPYLPFHVKGPSGELLNVEFSSASVVPPEPEHRPEEQQRQEEKAEESVPAVNETENGNKEESEGDNEKREDEPTEEISEERIEVEQNEQQQEEPPPKDPFDYHVFFPDETCISNYLEKNVETYQPFEHQEEKVTEPPEVERSSPSLPRFLTIPQNDQRQSGNTDTDTHPQPERELPAEKEAQPERKATTPPREVEPVAEKRELSKSKSMSCFPSCDVGAVETPPRSSIWKSQPNVNVDPNRKYSMPRLKPILPKQRSFSKSVPSEIPKVTLYTEFLISSEYKDPVDLPNDKIGFVETHIHKAGKLRRSKSDANIRHMFGPLPYVPTPKVEKPAPPMTIPRRHFDHDSYDLAKCKRQMGNKPKPKDAEKRKESIHSLPALKPIVPGKDKKSTLIKKRKSKELSPGDGGREKMAKRESRKMRERKRSVVTPKMTPMVNGNNLEEILQRLREFSKDYQHFFGEEAKPRAITCKHATVQASEGEEAEFGNSEPFEQFSRSGSTKSRETQTLRRGTPAVENSEFRQFRNYVKDQKETSQRGLLSIQDILSETKDGESVLTSATIENKSPVSKTCEKWESLPRIVRNGTPVKATDRKIDEHKVPIRDSSQPVNREEVKTNIGAIPKEQPNSNGKPLESWELENTQISPRTDRQSPTDSRDIKLRDDTPAQNIEKKVLIKSQQATEKGNTTTKQDEIGNASRKPTGEPVTECTHRATTAHRMKVAERLVRNDEGENKSSSHRRAECAVGKNSTGSLKMQNGHLAPLLKTKEKVGCLNTTAGVSRQDETTDRKVEKGGEMATKQKEILCVPDFDTPRTSRVSPSETANGIGKGRSNGIVDHHPDNSPDGAVRVVCKGKSDLSSSPSPLPKTPSCGNAISESFEDLKNESGIAGAIAQLSLEGGAGQRAEPGAATTAHEEYLRRQNWETGNMDYMGRDSFDNIWSKICQTIEAKELEEKAAGSPQPSTETPKPTEKLTEPTETPATLQKCPEYIETLPGEPAAGPVEDDEIIFSKPENRQSCLTNIAEEEEAGTEGTAGRSVKLSDILQGGGSVAEKLPNASGEKKLETEMKAEEKIEGKGTSVRVQDKPTDGPEKAECKTAPSADGQKQPEGKPEVTLGSVGLAGSPESQPTAAKTSAAQPTAVPPSATQPTATQPPTVQPVGAQPPEAQPISVPPPAKQPPVAHPPTAQPTAVPPPATQPTSVPPPATQPPVAQPPTAQPTAVPPPTAQPTAVPPPTAQLPAAQPPAAQPAAVPPPTVQPTSVPPPATQPPVAQPPTAQPTAVPPPATQPPVAHPPTAQPTAVPPPATQPTSVPPPATQPPVAQPPTAQPTAVPPPTAQLPAAQPPAAKPECKTVEIAQSTDEQKRPEADLQPEPEKKAEECKTVAIPSPPIFFPGSPFTDKPQPQSKPQGEKPELKSDPIPLPPPETTPIPQEAIGQTARSESPKEEGKQKKGVFTKILEMVGVAPKEKNGSDTSKSVFYDVDETGQPKPEIEKKTEEVDETGKGLAGATEVKGSGNAVQPEEKKLQTPKPEEGKIEEKAGDEEKPGQATIAKPARSPSPKEGKHLPGSIQVLPTRKSPSPKLTMPPKLPETEITMPTPPPQPEAPPRRNSTLLKVDDTILETPPVIESAREALEEAAKGKVATEIEDIIGKAKNEVESLLQERRSAEKEAGETESSDLINTMKMLMEGDQPGKSTAEEVEELRVTSEEERKRHKGEVITSKLSDQILKAIPPPRRKAISEASASTSAIPKATAEQKNPQQTGESKAAKPSKPSAIPVPPPRNRGKPTTPAPSKPKGKK